jgi:uncharacterized protein YjbI with pentapeptide repeats
MKLVVAIGLAIAMLATGHPAVAKTMAMRSTTVCLNVLKKAISQKKAPQLQNCNLDGVNLSSKKLRNLHRSNLTGSSLRGANLTLTQLTQAVLINTDFTNAILEQADLSNATVYGVKFVSASMDSAQLVNINRQYVPGQTLPNPWATSFEGAVGGSVNLTNAYLPYALFERTKFRSLNAQKAYLAHSTFTDSVLGRLANWRGANLGGITARGTQFSYNTFDGAILYNARFAEGTSFYQASFVAAKMEGVIAFSASFARANFDGALLVGAQLSQSEFGGAIFRQVDATAADFAGASLRTVDFNGASLAGVDFGGATLIGANFSNANLSSAILGSARLGYANLCKAKNITEATFADVDRESFKDALLPNGIWNGELFLGKCN